MEEILSHALRDGRTLLDKMYTTLLKEFTKGRSDVLYMFRSVMRQILRLKEPLSIAALDIIRKRWLDKKRGGVFFIQESNMRYDLALALLSIMQADLSFNICRPEMSYLSNLNVGDLEKMIGKKYIPPYLLYACRFWAVRLHDGGFFAELAQSVSGHQGKHSRLNTT